MCRMWWPLTLTYIFKVIWPWLWKSCLLCNVFSSRSIIFLTWDPIVWVIMRRRGVSSERRRSSCSSWNWFPLNAIYFVKYLSFCKKGSYILNCLRILLQKKYVSYKKKLRVCCLNRTASQNCIVISIDNGLLPIGGSSPPQVETFSVSKTLTLSQEHPFVFPLWARGPQRLGWGAELTHTTTGEW